MSIQFASEKLRKKIVFLICEYKAILALTFNLKPEDVEKLDGTRDRVIRQSTRKELDSLMRHWTGEVKRIRQTYKVCASPESLAAFLAKYEDNPDYLLEVGAYFKAFEDPSLVSPQFAEWPRHAKIDLKSPHLDRGFVEIHVIEAEMFESMAAMFNDARKYHEQYKASGDKTAAKYTVALYRGSIFAAFGLLECFLNGVAYDYFVIHEPTLDDDIKSILTDWDSVKNRPRYLQLKDKISKYQTILLGQKHAPLQPTNCPELKYLLDQGVPLRDAHVLVRVRRSRARNNWF